MWKSGDLFGCDSVKVALDTCEFRLLEKNAFFSGIVQLAIGQFVHVRIIHTAPRQGHPHRDQSFARRCLSQGHVVLGVPSHVILVSNEKSEQKTTTYTGL